MIRSMVMALTLGAVLSTSVHADQPLSLVSKDGRLVVTMYGTAVKYQLDRKAPVVCNGQNYELEGIDNFGNLYKSYAQVCNNGTGVFIKHFTELHEVQVAVTDKLFKDTLYRDQMLPGRAL